MSNLSNRILGVITTLSGFALGLVSVQPNINALIAVPSWVFLVLLIIGVATAVCGLVLLISPLLTVSFIPIHYQLEVAKVSDLKAVHDLAADEIGAGIISLKSLQEWHRANSSMLCVIWRKPRSLLFSKSSIVGFFCVVPVNDEAKIKLMKNREQAFQVSVDVILPKGVKPAAWYISALAASGSWFTRGRTLQQLEAYVNAKASEASLFLTAPTTEEGLRVALNKGFIATDASTPPLQTIFYRDFV